MFTTYTKPEALKRLKLEVKLKPTMEKLADKVGETLIQTQQIDPIRDFPEVRGDVPQLYDDSDDSDDDHDSENHEYGTNESEFDEFEDVEDFEDIDEYDDIDENSITGINFPASKINNATLWKNRKGEYKIGDLPVEIKDNKMTLNNKVIPFDANLAAFLADANNKLDHLRKAHDKLDLGMVAKFLDAHNTNKKITSGTDPNKIKIMKKMVANVTAPKGKKLGTGIVLIENVNDAVNLLKTAVGQLSAGNTSLENKNLLSEAADLLLKHKVITKSKYKSLLKLVI